MRLLSDLLLYAGALGLVILGFVDFAPPRNVQNANLTKSKLGIITAELSAFQTQNGRFPSTEEGLHRFELQGSQHLLQTDPWGNPWIYRNPSEKPGLAYDLYSAGANAKDDGGEFDDLRPDTNLSHESYQEGLSFEYRLLAASAALLVVGLLSRFLFR